MYRPWLAFVLAAAVSPPAGAAAQTLTLKAAILRAQQASPLATATRARVDAATKAVDFLTRFPNPIVELRGENFGADAAHLPLDSFAVVTQPIELGGKAAARRGDLSAAVLGATAAEDLTRRDITVAVASLYVDALRASGARASLTRQKDGLGEIVRILTRRTDEGSAAESDLRKFESERARVDTELVRADVQLQSALVRLAAALREPVVTPDRPVMPPLDLVAASGGDFSDTQIDRRPDVLAARSRVERARALVQVEKARGVPDLLVSGGFKRTAGVGTGVVGVAVPIPLFDRNRASIAIASGELAAAEMELAYVREQARADVHALELTAERLLSHAATIERTHLAPASVVRVAARSAFQEGAGDVLRLVDAERVHAEAVRALLDIRLDALLATIDVRLARGEEPLP